MSVGGEDGVADGVDAAVDAVQPASSRPMGHGPLREPEGRELPRRDHAVLARRQRRNLAVHRPNDAFQTHGVSFSSLARHGRSVAGKLTLGAPRS